MMALSCTLATISSICFWSGVAILKGGHNG